MKLFQKGDHVLYVPRHARGACDHPDCQKGVVSSMNDKNVFVKYDNLQCEMKTGDEPFIAHATDPDDLVSI